MKALLMFLLTARPDYDSIQLTIRVQVLACALALMIAQSLQLLHEFVFAMLASLEVRSFTW